MEKMISNIAIFILCAMIVATESDQGVKVPEEVLETLPYMVTKHGYIVNEYNVTTEDGYIIRMHQMRSKRGVTQVLPILLVHGIIGSSEDYLRMGPKRSLAYLLADSGYDVWLGNLRGNLYTSHVKLSKHDYAFWNFSFDEHGKYDVPVMVEKVLEVTNASRLHYLGYSMGVTSYCIACNERPDVMRKVATFTGLAPATFLGKRTKAIAKFIFDLQIMELLKALHINALVYNEELQRLVVSTFCREETRIGNLCYQLAHFLVGEDYDQVQWNKTLTIFMKFQPATVKQLEHFGQLALTGSLSKFNWGKQGNLNEYGQSKPPKYDLSANKAPTAIFYGLNDILTVPLGANRLSRSIKTKVPNVLLKPRPFKKFNHIDFLYSKDVNILLNYDIINTIPVLYNNSKLL